MKESSQRTGATRRLARIRAPPPIGYRGPFKNMNDIYQVYRKTLMNTGQYRAYFTPRLSYEETSQKFRKTEYSPERQTRVSEGEVKEQYAETNTDKNTETKNEINKTEVAQKTEDSSKTEVAQKVEREKKPNENQTELSYEKSGLPESYEVGQTDIKIRNRPSPYYDRAEMR